MRLDQMDLATVRRAVETYLRHAYPSGEPPPEVRARLTCLEAPTLMEALRSEHVEREVDDERGTLRYALRLGSEEYPHLKVVLARCSNTDEFVISVDTHDRHFVLPDNVPPETRERFEAVQARNLELKQAIESEWDRAHLPTFRRFIEEGLAVGK